MSEIADLFSEIGTAAIVSLVIGATVELSLRRIEERNRQMQLRQDEERHKERLEAIEKNVFNYLFRFFVDPIILDEVKIVFAEHFMRKGLRVSYSFLAAPKDLRFQDGQKPAWSDDLLTVRVTVEYELCNLGRDAETHEVVHYFESTLPLAREHSRFTEFRLKQTGKADLTLQDQDRVMLDEPKHPIRRLIRVAKEHLSIRPGNPVRVFFIYETIRRCHDHEIWVSTLPADRFELSVMVDSSLPNMLFCADGSHRIDPELVSDGPIALRWEIRSGILPGQGMMLYWMPAGNSTQAEDRPTTGSAFSCERIPVAETRSSHKSGPSA